MPENQCPIEIKPMADWVGEEDPDGLCRSCILGPVVQWYRDELQEQGQQELAENLVASIESDDAVKICKEMDDIKEQVDEELKDRLLEFDCSIQSFKPDPSELQE